MGKEDEREARHEGVLLIGIRCRLTSTWSANGLSGSMDLGLRLKDDGQHKGNGITKLQSQLLTLNEY